MKVKIEFEIDDIMEAEPILVDAAFTVIGYLDPNKLDFSEINDGMGKIIGFIKIDRGEV
ncbi:MAG: hypothetical protein WC356_06810 [Candidatus Micrarchaeia archaeon]|jgi:hypothetical protein